MIVELMRKIVKFIDPKLEKYREHKPEVKPPKYTPRTLEDFIGVIQRTPKDVLNATGRKRIAAVMSFDDKTVKDLMIPKAEMVLVEESEMLGPLKLDKLYKSGLTDFPVVDSKERVVGVLHTEALNALEIRKTDAASKYMDKSIHYLRSGDTLKFVVEEIEQTNSYFFLVLDEKDELAGFFTVKMLIDYLIK